jgi:NTP pyrophosphatase (non-canonical NTP hydrolase)
VTELIIGILNELEDAKKAYPMWPADPLHAVNVLGEEYGELVKAILQQTYEPHKVTKEDIRKEAIQTAAMAIRFAANLDHYEYEQSNQLISDPTTKKEGK